MNYSKLGLIALILASMLRMQIVRSAPDLPGDRKLVRYNNERDVYIDGNVWFDNWITSLPADHQIRVSARGQAEYPPIKRRVVTFDPYALFEQKERVYAAGVYFATENRRKSRRLVLINVEQMLNEQVGDSRQYRVWPHLGLIFVGTVADEEGYEVVMWDEYAKGFAPLEKLIQPNDIVGLSLVITGIDRGIELARRAKELGAQYVIVGNDSAIFRANQVMSLEGRPVDAVFTSNSGATIRTFFREIGDDNIRQLRIPGVQLSSDGDVRSNDRERLLVEFKTRKAANVNQNDAFVVPKLTLYPHWEELWSNYRATFGHKHSNPQEVKNAIALFAQGCTRTRGTDACVHCTIAEVADIRIPTKEMMRRTVQAYADFGVDMVYNATDSVYEMGRVAAMLQELGASWRAMKIYGRAQGIAHNPNLIDEWQQVATERLLINVGMESGSDELLMRGVAKSSVKVGSRIDENREAVRRIGRAGAHLHCSFIFGSPGESKETCESSIRFIEWMIETLGHQLDICETDIFWLNFGSPASRVFYDYRYAQQLAGFAGKSISNDEWRREFVLYANELVVPLCVEESWYHHFTTIDLETAQAYNQRAAEIMAKHTGSIRGRAFRPA